MADTQPQTEPVQKTVSQFIESLLTAYKESLKHDLSGQIEEKYEKELSRLREENDSLAAQCAAPAHMQPDRTVELQAEIEALKAKITETETAAAAAKKTVDQLTHDKNIADANFNAIVKEKDIYKANYKKVIADFGQLQQRYADIGITVSTFDEQKKTFESRITELEKDKAGIWTKYEEEIASFRTAGETLKKDNEQLRNENTALNTQAQTLVAEIKQLQTAQEKLEQSLQTQQSASTLAEFEALRGTITRLENEKKILLQAREEEKALVEMMLKKNKQLPTSAIR